MGKTAALLQQDGIFLAERKKKDQLRPLMPGVSKRGKMGRTSFLTEEGARATNDKSGASLVVWRKRAIRTNMYGMRHRAYRRIRPGGEGNLREAIYD